MVPNDSTNKANLKSSDGQNIIDPQKPLLRILPEVCIRCGTCLAIYPEFFDMTPEGEVKVKDDAQIPESMKEEIKSVCPSSAISDNLD